MEACQMSQALSILHDLRIEYHKQLQQVVWRYVGDNKPSNSDKDSDVSVRIGRGMLEEAGEPGLSIAGQTAGKNFTDITLIFLQQAFYKLNHIRPGQWIFSVSQANIGIAAFYQYEHLATLQHFLNSLQETDVDGNMKDLRAAFVKDYLITPDIVICRDPLNDEDINKHERLIELGDHIATHTPLRAANNSTRILHASVSCKWTIRSDRAQNSRTEALNLVRNRKGHVPHIVVITGEPLPTRLASIALGTGDIDCVYHMALFELEAAVRKSKEESQGDMLDTLVRGRRLRDISDLPFDLMV
jgi:hypothetical protein